jgi:HlyD family secretion protein
MQLLVKKPIVLIAIVALAAAVSAWRWHERNNHKTAFRTAMVKRGDIAAIISATGTVEPEQVVDVGAQVAGLISAFGKDVSGHTIDYGSVVEEGTVLATIDESVYAADLALAKAQVEQDKAGELSAAANLEQMKARLVQAEADWRRAQELSQSKLMAQADYDSYNAAYAVSKANLSVAEAAVAQAKAATIQAQALLQKAQRNLDFCTIKSPVKGVIIDRRVNIGQTVVASLNAPSLFLIAKDLTRMQIWVSVNEADVGRIIPGAPVVFTCDAFPGKEFNGSVGKVRLNATMTQNVVMYTVEVNTENPDSILLPYLTANVRFLAQNETNVLLVPNQALRWSPASLALVSPESRTPKPVDPPASNPAAAETASASANTPSSSKPAGSKRGKPATPASPHVGVLWLTDGEFVRPVEVALGISDGTRTALTTGSVQEGDEVVIGENADSAQAGPRNPFLPQAIRR